MFSKRRGAFARTQKRKKLPTGVTRAFSSDTNRRILQEYPTDANHTGFDQLYPGGDPPPVIDPHTGGQLHPDMAHKRMHKMPADSYVSDYAASIGVEGGPYAEHDMGTENEGAYQMLESLVGPERARQIVHEYASGRTR
ncbi:MAG: hypothetical protein AAGK02_08060 [Pseudomonadota bacterium]